jgi:hypothetical protein
MTNIDEAVGKLEISCSTAGCNLWKTVKQFLKKLDIEGSVNGAQW